ncbi:ABC transporter permease [Roseiconus lacunae]|uniref:ABC transporter permease n=1 Tax=Roseiconus lacunae TaxID=2605694 RepID=A0ABT7PQ06_9BACT|nr:ABC transporter permease [Roseiconus lacunae]MDM4018558.1 ABC transporter permease [Roseiconus lacunae]WRQ52613.1 ABC transporter permease [Stieleria sp. HD01]
MLANFTAASSGFLFDAASTMGSGLVVGQIGDWMPSWATPIYAISLGLLLGAVVAAAFYAVLALLSFVPPLGKLADNSTRGTVASLIVGVVVGAMLCMRFASSSDEYAQTLYLPLLLAGIVIGYAVIYGMWHRTRSEWADILSEGVVPYVLSTLGAFTLIGVLGAYYVNDPMQFIESIPQVNLISDGTVVHEVTVPGANPSVAPDEATFHAQQFDYDLRAMSELIIESDKTVMLGDGASIAEFSRKPARIDAGEQMVYRYEDRDVPPLPSDPAKLHIQNRELDAATVKFTITTVPRIPEISQAVAIGCIVFFLISALVAFRQAAPRVWALALSTAKNEMAQTLYLILLALGIFGVVFFSIYPFNTLGDDIRMFKDSSVTLIMVLAMIQAVWSAGTSVSDEIEGRTALTVLSKPVSRRSFLLGKYAGIMMSIAVMFVIIGAIFLLLMAYKPIYDARETARATPGWQIGFEEIMSTVPVLGLYFMQAMSIAAVAVALATRLPLLSNLISCLVIYVIGNLTQPLVASARGENPLVGFVGNLIAIVVPNLNIFNVQTAMDSGNQVPWIYLAASFNYLVVFAVAIWMVAMLLFEDRDLA